MPIPAFVPMSMFAIVFGLSMDYEVLLLSPVREEYLRTGDNGVAVSNGLATAMRRCLGDNNWWMPAWLGWLLPDAAH